MAPPSGYIWCQFNMTSSKCLYCSKHQVIILTVYIYRRETCTSHKTSAACFSPAHKYTSSQILYYLRRFGGDLWWFAYTMLAPANRHKPQPKRRKYAGFGPMGIHESIVLHRYGWLLWRSHGLDKLLAFYQHTNGGLWWFAVICGGLRWFVL